MEKQCLDTSGLKILLSKSNEDSINALPSIFLSSGKQRRLSQKKILKTNLQSAVVFFSSTCFFHLVWHKILAINSRPQFE
jgi:hypothetical protein